MIRNATAQWQGNLKQGKGKVTTSTGVLSNTPYSFKDRFEDGKATNPEELIAAAHAACFSMALSGKLEAAGMTADSIETRADLSFEKLEAGWTVTSIHLDLKAKIPNADKAAFEKAAQDAKAGCPISRLLNAKITLDAKLV